MAPKKDNQEELQAAAMVANRKARPAAIKVKAKEMADLSKRIYGGADKVMVEALWAHCGRDRVKGLKGHQKMTIAAIAETLGEAPKEK